MLSVIGFRTYEGNIPGLNILSEGVRENSRSRKVSLTFPCPSPLKQARRLSCERCLPYSKRKGISLSPWRKNTKKNQNRPCKVSPSLQPLTHTLCPITFLHNVPLFNTPNIKILEFNHLFESL